MRIHSSPVVVVGSKRPCTSGIAPACRGGNVSACAKFSEHAHFFHIVVLLMPSHPIRQHDGKFKTALASRSRGMCPGKDYRFPPIGFALAWTIFQDTRIALSHSCCAIFVLSL